MAVQGIAPIAPLETKQRQWKYAHLIRVPGDPIQSEYRLTSEIGSKVRAFLALHQSPLRRKAPRAFWLPGPSGSGKTTAVLLTCLAAGFAVASVSASEFAGAHEGDATAIIDEMLTELQEWSKVYRLPVVLHVDDVDLSIAAADENTSKTVNSGLFIVRLMKLSDDKHLFLTCTGAPITFIFTANNTTSVRESLMRDGRASVHEHIPTTEEKTNIAWRVLDPQTSDARRLVQRLASKHAASQSVAFWEALALKIRELAAKHVFEKGMPTQAEIDRVYSEHVPLDDADLVWAAARDLRKNRVKDYLAKRFAFSWGGR